MVPTRCSPLVQASGFSSPFCPALLSLCEYTVSLSLLALHMSFTTPAACYSCGLLGLLVQQTYVACIAHNMSVVFRPLHKSPFLFSSDPDPFYQSVRHSHKAIPHAAHYHCKEITMANNIVIPCRNKSFNPPGIPKPCSQSVNPFSTFMACTFFLNSVSCL